MMDLGRLRVTGAVTVEMDEDGPVLRGVNQMLRSPG